MTPAFYLLVMNNVELILDCRECHNASHVYKDETNYENSKEKGWLCPACIGKSHGSNSEWLEKNRAFLQQKGFEGKMKQLGVSQEEYYGMLDAVAKKQCELKEERRRLRHEETSKKRAVRKELMNKYLIEQRAKQFNDVDEQWRVIEKYPRYECSTNGRIRNTVSLRVLCKRHDSYGYQKTGLYSDTDKKQATLNVHRVVADTWIPNTNNHPQVHHINHVKDDNRVCNLQWVTCSENSVLGWNKQ